MRTGMKILKKMARQEKSMVAAQKAIEQIAKIAQVEGMSGPEEPEQFIDEVVDSVDLAKPAGNIIPMEKLA